MHILIIDDDNSVLASLSLLLKQHNFNISEARNPASALEFLKQKAVDLILQDMNFSRSTQGEEGLALLRDIKKTAPQIPVILMTAWGSISLAVAGMRLGASDFITKPWDNPVLIKTINTIIGLPKKEMRSVINREDLDKDCDFSSIIGNAPNILNCLNTVARVCATDASVLIIGESGTGKELIAEAIHRNSNRSKEALVKVNLGAVNADLFEREMFGHIRGAFTDAKQDSPGLFSSADNGTIFLDEIGELALSSQVKLLRVLQDQKFQAIGSSKTTSVNVRIISATNRDLEKLINQGDFREDLFYRINLITIHLPPLRERTSDIPLLAKHHLKKTCIRYQLPPAILTSSAQVWLQRQIWPGNIRQLCQTIERAALVSGNHELDEHDFIQHSQHALTQETRPKATNNLNGNTLEEIEKNAISQAMKQLDNNISKVASHLGLSRAALYRRLEKYGFKKTEGDT